MVDLKPIYDDVQAKRYDGRFRVQLEIPSCSTLTQSEMDEIGALSSWSVDPNGIVDGYEGGRAVIIAREKGIEKKEIKLDALQVSGIGYTPIEIGESVSSHQEEKFYPPSKENFMNYMPRTKMSTSFAQGRQILSTRPEYRARGTYTALELIQKLNGTMKASRFELEHMVVPHVEAYGRYLDDELRNADGEFGFAVFPVPTGIGRSTEQIFKMLEKLPIKDIPQEFLFPALGSGLYYIFAGHAAGLLCGARELHDKARIAHLQLHLSNFYMVAGLPYVIDWGTLRELGEDREENIGNRTLDLMKPAENFVDLFFGLFPMIPKDVVINKIYPLVLELSMELYLGNPKVEIKDDLLTLRTHLVTGKSRFDYIESAIQWMKDQGFEGFPKHNYSAEKRALRNMRGSLPATQISKTQKIGRNSPCPCGSGKKYKKCCGFGL